LRSAGVKAAGTRKIVVTGARGCGKTTLVRALSRTRPLSTEAALHDSIVPGDTTTIGMDHGMLTRDDGRVVQLYGTPGYLRFAFMRQILARGADGVIVLIDQRSATAAEDFEQDARLFSHWFDAGKVAVGLTHGDTAPNPLRKHSVLLLARSFNVPVMVIDARSGAQARLLLGNLLHALETAP
jgi:uncharacterized protein